MVAYLSAGFKVFTLGENTLVVVDVVLPAVLGPGEGSWLERDSIMDDDFLLLVLLLLRFGDVNVLVLVWEASVVSSYLNMSEPIPSLPSNLWKTGSHTGDKLEGLGNVSTEVVGVGHLDIGHFGGCLEVSGAVAEGDGVGRQGSRDGSEWPGARWCYESSKVQFRFSCSSVV